MAGLSSGGWVQFQPIQVWLRTGTQYAGSSAHSLMCRPASNDASGIR